MKRHIGDNARRATRVTAAFVALLAGLVLTAPAQAAVSHTFVMNALTITTTAGDTVQAACSAGNETTVNGVALAGPAVPCTDVHTMTVNGDDLPNTINLSGVTPALFPALTGVSTYTNVGDDVFTGSAVADYLEGGNGNDTITGGLGDDVLFGGNANDTLTWSPGDGSDALNGQGGDDIVQITGDGSGDTFTIAGDGDGFDVDRAGGGHVEIAVPNEIISISTGDGADTITGGTGLTGTRTALLGGNGIDTITGTDTADTITGGAGNDILSGADSNDTAIWNAGDGSDVFDGGAGTDIARLNGDATGETFTVAPDGSGVDIDRTAPSADHIEADTIERVEVDAGDGADTVAGGSGFAALGISTGFSGGSGNDILTGSDGADSLTGGTDTDTLTGGAGDDTANWTAGDGSDTVSGGSGSDLLQVNGDSTGETITVAPDGGDIDVDRNAPSTDHVDAAAIERVSVGANAGTDTITASAGIAALGVALTLTGGSDGDTITGSDGDDTINGGAGSDDVAGGDGDDRLSFSPQATATDAIEGGAGHDTLVVDPESGNGAWTLQPDTGKIRLQRTGVTVRAGTIEHLSMDLGSGADSLVASGELAALGLQSTTIKGDSGNDTIVGTDVADTLDGGASTDNVDGAGGDDTISPGTGSGTSTDTVAGGAGTDTVTLTGDASGETFTLAPDGSGVDIDRTATVPVTAGHVELENSEALVVDGADGADTFLGGTGIAALGIDITLAGGAGDDTITGTDGADAIAGEGGADTINGADGADTMTWSPGDGSDTVDGGAGTDRSVVNGDATGEQFAVTATGARVAFARSGADPFTLDIGTTEQLELDAGDGDDVATAADGLGALIALTLRGDGGADTITGADGSDALSGGAGNDTVTGGDGADILGGDAGDDTIAARDGEADQVSCGDGTDTTTADAADTTTACETVSLAPVVPPPPPAPPPAAPAPPPSPVATDTTKPRIGVSVRNPVRRGVASLVVSCPKTESSCRISAKLRRGGRTVGSAKATLAGGRSRTLRVRLDARTQRSLRTSRTVRVTCEVTGTDAAGNRSKRTVSLRLRSSNS